MVTKFPWGTPGHRCPTLQPAERSLGHGSPPRPGPALTGAVGMARIQSFRHAGRGLCLSPRGRLCLSAPVPPSSASGAARPVRGGWLQRPPVGPSPREPPSLHLGPGPSAEPPERRRPLSPPREPPSTHEGAVPRGSRRFHTKAPLTATGELPGSRHLTIQRRGRQRTAGRRDSGRIGVSRTFGPKECSLCGPSWCGKSRWLSINRQRPAGVTPRQPPPRKVTWLNSAGPPLSLRITPPAMPRWSTLSPPRGREHAVPRVRAQRVARPAPAGECA